jgi:uncharacterized protein YggE
MAGETPSPHVVVRGEAVLFADPELAVLDVTVRARGRDRETALERCAARQAEVTDVVTTAGDAVESVETAGTAVYPETSDGGLTSSVATVHTRLTVARPEAAGELVLALGRLDDVEVAGPGWRLRPDSPVVEQARLAAVRDAVHRARQYAAAFGAQLVTLLEVRDAGLSGSGPRVADAMATMARFESGELHLDLAPARQEVHGAVEVRFAMSAPDQEVFRA